MIDPLTDLTIGETAEKLSVSHVKPRRMVAEGILRVHSNPLGNRRKLVPVSDLIAVPRGGQPPKSTRQARARREQRT